MKNLISSVTTPLVFTKVKTDVLDSDIPLLLSRVSMKRADMKINFKDDTGSILWLRPLTLL